MIWDNAIECKELRLRALAESPVLQNLYTSCIPCYFHFLRYEQLRLIIDYDNDDADFYDYTSVAPQWHLSRDKCSAFMLLLTH